ncbi:aspartate aminotransferase family protein [Parendozoicomonas haliclonae]|uniref:Acetylornithine aminotransferase n=1 Tax=Parendozoicomonas haliclonae TaxID=1960125 RepID=A0A1X7AKY6_9GAMM|nr:aspartate aminotransferase family protein [Parendozoicomonas haliclonae]SMA47646.1 Succinylornithine transaminase/acetylornithine aminotransferase [Parendozoicomonas haliclonae]
MTDTPLNRAVFDQVMVPNYNPAACVPVRGEGSRVWDQEGREYIDFAGGIAVNVLGHNHPKLVGALTEQASKIWHLSNVYTNEPVLELGLKLTNLTFADRVFFCNSGAEANEAAFKLARKYAFDTVDEEKNEVISFQQSFHGRTLFTVSVGGQKKYREGFAPVPEGISHVPFNDIEALKEAISDKTCAVVMEPVQGEGGVIPADPAFVKAVRELCDQHNALLIFDEVQTGVGRTGSLYAYMDMGVTPDILTTAKSLGGGFPIGAMLTRKEIAGSLGIGTHGTTYGGNPLASAVANAVLDTVATPEVMAGVKSKESLFVQRLEDINKRFNVFRDIRSAGLLIGAELEEPWRGKGGAIIAKAREFGVMLLIAGPNVLRMTPSLVITEEEINLGMDRLEQTLEALISEAE